MAWTIRRNDNDVVLYSLSEEPVLFSDHIECLHPSKGTPLIIADLNEDNVKVEEVADEDVPEDYIGVKYKFVGGAFIANPDWIDIDLINSENPPE